jgi:hypothetical protein
MPELSSSKFEGQEVLRLGDGAFWLLVHQHGRVGAASSQAMGSRHTAFLRVDAIVETVFSELGS